MIKTRGPRALLSITKQGIEKLSDLLKNSSAIGIKVGVNRKGCNGLSYTMDYIYTENRMDEKIIVNNIAVYIQPQALFYIIGSEMDFVVSDLKSEFTFSNPNAKGKCGCGESFSM